jgi:ribosomal protein L37E
MRTDPRNYKKLIFCKLCGKKIFVENLNKQYCNDCISLRGANGTKKNTKLNK